MRSTSINAAMFIASVTFLVSYLGTVLLIPFLRRKGIVDVPNARSSHTKPTPRGGGIAVAAGIGAGAMTAAILDFPLPWSVLAAAAMVGLIGLIDDCTGGISAGLRLAAQACLALWVVAPGGGFERFPLPPPADFAVSGLGTVLAVIWIVAVCNIYNFLDGIDGFAAMQGALAGFGLALLDAGPVSTTGLALLGASSGFLIHNWHPARVFMGDVGSTSIGFLVAALPFSLPVIERERTVFAMAIFLWFFLSDGAYTLGARLLRGEKIWRPHRCHLYQRLSRTGVRPDRVVARLGIMGFVLAVVEAEAYRGSDATRHWLALAVAIAGFVAYVFWVRSREVVPASDPAGSPRGSGRFVAAVGSSRPSGAMAGNWKEDSPRQILSATSAAVPDTTDVAAGAVRRGAED